MTYRDHERDYIQRGKHGVKGRTVKLPAHWRASDTQRALVEALGLPELPDYGMTYRLVRNNVRYDRSEGA